MQEIPNIQQNGGNAEAMLEAHRIALSRHEIEFLVEVLHHPDHEPRHIRVKRDATLLEVLDESARKLDVKLLPNARAPLDRLHGVYEHHRIGEALDLGLTVEDFLRQEAKPLPPDTPVKLHRGERFEAQRDGKYGALPRGTVTNNAISVR